MLLLQLLALTATASTAHAQFFNFFGGGHEQHQQPQQAYEDTFLNHGCAQYLCPDTQTCVASPKDCPCPFPKSQLKCPVGDKFVCISKPATNDENLIKLYDDPVKGPKAKTEGLRDCGWVEKAYKGLV